MKRQPIIAGLVSLFLGFGTQAFAQSQRDSAKPFTHGESKRCESLSGPQKEQCDKDEATKTQGPAAQEPAKTPQPSTRQDKPAAGSTTPEASRTDSDKGVPMPTD